MRGGDGEGQLNGYYVGQTLRGVQVGDEGLYLSGVIDVTLYPYLCPTDGTSDCYAAVNQAIQDIKNKKVEARNILLPYNGNGGYKFSDQLYVNFSHLVFYIEDDCTLTKTTKSCLFKFSGNFSASDATYLKGIGIILSPGVVLDGNAPNITGYTYSTADTYYSTVLFMYCDRPYLTGAGTVKNGLVNTVRMWMCRKPLVADVLTRDSYFDNGISLDFDPSFYSASDPETWCSGKVLRCSSYGNARGFGMTSFASTNNLWEDCTSINNGSDNIPSGQGGVPGGGFSLERNPTDGLSYDYRARYKNCRSESNIGNGWFITGNGGHIDADCISKNNTYPLAGAAVSDDAGIYGTGVTLLSVSNWTVLCDAENNTKYNIRYLGSNGVFGYNIKIGAKALNAQFSGILIQGINEVTILPETHCRSNSTSSTGSGLSISNVGAPYNEGAGKVTVLGGLFSDNGGTGITVDGVADCSLAAIRGRNNCANQTTSPAVLVRNTAMVSAGDVLTFGSYQTYSMAVEATCAKSAVMASCGGQGTAGQVQNLATQKLQENGSFA